jgi:tRNA G18 (ribose-2'-O)-methylase SpoU
VPSRPTPSTASSPSGTTGVFEQVRHRPAAPLDGPRELVLACAAMRSNVNLSTILRTAGCCAIEKVIMTGNVKIDRAVAREGPPSLALEVHSSLVPVLHRLRKEGYPLVGLEQTTNSVDVRSYAFPRRMVLVIGNERKGLSAAELALMDTCVEIPVWGLPYSYNVAIATSLALYEYCRRHPT